MASMRGWIILLLTTVSSLVVLGTMGYSITFKESGDQTLDFANLLTGQPVRPGYWHVEGTSAHVFLFVTSCMAVFFGTLVLLHPNTGVDTMAGTFYYFASHVVLFIFYVSGAIAMLVYVGAYGDKNDAIQRCTTTAGVFGIISALGHAATAYLSRVTD